MQSSNESRAATARGFAGLYAALMLVFGLGVGPAQAAPFAYVSNSRDGTVSVIDTGARPPVVVGTPISVGSTPSGVAVTPDGKQVYVVNNVSPGIVSVIATATNKVTTVGVGRLPFCVAITPDGTRAYVTNGGDNTVSVIDTASNTVVGTPISMGNPPIGVAVTPDGKQVYVVNDVNPGIVSVIATATNKVTTVAVGRFPSGVAITPDGTRAYVTNNDGTVSVIDTASNRLVGTPIVVGTAPAGVAVTPDGKHVYVANGVDGTVSVIATASNTVAGPPIKIGRRSSPSGVAVTPDGKHVYVANFNSFDVSVIDTGTNMMVATIAVGNAPVRVGIGLAPAGVPFAAFSAQVAIQFGKKPGQDSFEIAASFTLGKAGKGINPVTDEVTLKVGKFTTTIPPGSFKTNGLGTFAFEGVIGGASVEAVIFPTGTRRYELVAAAQKADLTGTKNPVPVALTIGDGNGTISVNAIILGGLAAAR